MPDVNLCIDIYFKSLVELLRDFLYRFVCFSFLLLLFYFLMPDVNL